MISPLEYTRNELRAVLNQVESLKDEWAAERNNERKARRSLRWFDKASDTVGKELEDCAGFIVDLSKNIDALSEGAIKTEHIRKRDEIIERQRTLQQRAPLYSAELRKEKENYLQSYIDKVEMLEKLIAKFETKRDQLEKQIAERQAAGEV